MKVNLEVLNLVVDLCSSLVSCLLEFKRYYIFNGKSPSIILIWNFECVLVESCFLNLKVTEYILLLCRCLKDFLFSQCFSCLVY
jgi:hypothetical protein